MKKQIVMIYGIIMISLLIFGCSTDNESQNCSIPLTGDLTSIESSLVGNWVLTTMVSENEIDLTDDDVNNPNTNIFEQFSECERDVIYSFNSDRQFSFKQGYTAALCNNKEAVDGTWKFSQNQLTLVVGCATQSIAIILNSNISSFTFEGNYSFQDINGLTLSTKVTSTYEKSM